MWMEFQGKKATHDFLSLYTKDSSFNLQDSRPPPSQGFYLKTHDFLKPLEEEKEEEPEKAQQVGPTTVSHVLPGGIGTYSISHVADRGSPAAVKPEVVTCRPGPALGSKPEPDSGYGSYDAGMAFTLWDARDNGLRGQWPAHFGAHSTTSFSSRNQQAQDKKRFMESGSRSSRGFDEEDEDDDELGKREGTSKKVELTVKVDGKGGTGNDQKATTPRSKHSATEQRRRSKINNRFQILREIIPHSDQKRDKASFLLEVIEYIRFLREKVQKQETSYPGWSEENARLMPWVKVYFRSFWKNARSSNQISGHGASDSSQIIKNGQAPGFVYTVDDNRASAAPGMLSTAQNPIENETSAGVSYKDIEHPVCFSSKPKYASVEIGAVASLPQQRLISDIDNMASQSQYQWLRPSSCPADYCVGSDVSHDQEELTIDEGTISVSSAYSQNILNSLNQALERSGIDLSQANVSVQINLGKRATRRRATATTMSFAKGLNQPLSENRPVIGLSRVGTCGEEFEQAPKRRRSDAH